MTETLFGKKHNMKCFGSTTVGERGQIVLPSEVRKLYGIEPGHKLIVLGNDYGGMQGIALLKSEDLAKMFEYVSEIEKMTKDGEKGFETLKKEGFKKMQAFKEIGIENMKKAAKKSNGKKARGKK